MGIIHVRDYRESDLEPLTDVFRQAVLCGPAEHYTAEQRKMWASVPEHDEQWRAKRLVQPTYIARVDEALVGFTDLAADGRIGMLYVHPAAQRRGVAHTLLAHAEMQARKLGIPLLYTHASMTARSCCEAAGYRVIRQQAVLLRGMAFINFRMEKLLMGTMP